MNKIPQLHYLEMAQMSMIRFCSSESARWSSLSFQRSVGKSSRCCNGTLCATILVGPPYDAFHNADNGQSGGLLSLFSFQCGDLVASFVSQHL